MNRKYVLFKTSMFLSILIAVLIIGTAETLAQTNQTVMAATDRPSDIEPISAHFEMTQLIKPKLFEGEDDSLSPLKVLNLLAYGGVAQMQYKFGGEPGGEVIDLDDSNWKTIEIGYKWHPSNSNVWFRTVLEIPDHIGGFSIVGKAMTIKLQVDNAYDLFVNEKQVAKDIPWKGETALAHDIQPGQRFVIAIRGINRPGPGQLINAQIEFSGLEDFQKKLRQYISHFFTIKKYARLYPDEWGDIEKEAKHLAKKIVRSSAFKNGNETELIELLKRETKELRDNCENWLTFHHIIRNEQGVLLPWTSWNDALEREMNWYQKCPFENGYPRFVTMTFMDDNYELIDSTFIPATQNGMGIISYLKYYKYKDRKDAGVLQFARLMGNYLIHESITPDIGKYPRFSRSTGWAGKTPQSPDCGSQADGPYEIEPDKGGIVGYALLLLFEETGENKYLDQALQNAQGLAANMVEGDENRSPWPFRVDYRSGAGRGEVSGNMSYILRLFDGLIEHGYDEFKNARNDLWSWVLKYQLPNAEGDGQLWVQFFEDHEELDNRTAWSALNMARYLIEKQSKVDQHWMEHSKALIEFVNNNFTSTIKGIRVCGEQDYDTNAWGGVLANYGGVLAMYSAATGSDEYKSIAYEALNFCLYSIRKDGCSAEGHWSLKGGGWQEDCHTDVIHNYIDAISAFPEWAN